MGKIIGGVVVVVVLVALFFMWNGKKEANAPITEEGSANTAEQKESAGTKSGMVASIKDAMGLGQKMQCTYKSGAGDTALTSTVYVDGQKFKSESEVNGTKVYALFDGEMQYTWMSNTKQGTKMSKACLDEMKAAVPEATAGGSVGATQPEDYSKKFDMANNVKCEAAGSADFSVPKDITFTDQCAMMKESLKLMEQFKDKMPAGVTVPSAY